MLLLEGYTKRIYIDRASAACGGPPWAIRVTNGRGRTVTFRALSWRLRRSRDVLHGCGSIDYKLIPPGPVCCIETTMAIEATIALELPEGALTAGNRRARQPPKGPPAGAPCPR